MDRGPKTGLKTTLIFPAGVSVLVSGFFSGRLAAGNLDEGRVASSEYRIVHCCNVVDCIDQEQSEFEWDGLSTPSMVLERAVLTPAVLDGDGRLIRPKFVPGKVFYRADLAEAIDAEEFDGVTFLQDLFE